MELWPETTLVTCGEIEAANPCSINVGSYLQCTAKGSAGQMCTKGFTENGVYWCAWVRSDGMCAYYK